MAASSELQRLPAEWEPQDAILLTWPHKDTGWAFIIDDMVQLYEALISVICDYADLVIAIPGDAIEQVQQRLADMDVPLEHVYFYPAESNDTWARDHGPLGVQTAAGIKLLDFKFNGWGGKYPYALDDKIPEQLRKLGAFPSAEFETVDLVLEGGSIDVDGLGALLTTTSCLLNQNRNPHLSKEEIEDRLRNYFGVQKIHWLESGYLQGDDTDGHIDTLARFSPNNTIVYTACDDEQDEHYTELKNMEAELAALTNVEGLPYRLLPLPWPGAKYGEQGNRLPATYANFLVVNEAVLVPIYDSLSDEDALEVISRAFPGYEIFGIPCLDVIERGGSLHCITMQLPEGVLWPALNN
jgi:agmatine deiminase